MNRWRVVDQLLRELGSLRVEANRRYQEQPQLEAAVTSAIEGAIRNAADAVDRTIDADDDEVLIQAWEAVVVAQDTLAARRDESARARQNVTRSLELRRAAARLMMNALSPREAGKPTTSHGE
jgi:hypothetical protein